MAIRPLVYIPDPRLRTICEPVTDFGSSELQTLIDDMIETMYHERGVGLAANQIGICKQITVIDVSDDKDQVMCLVNPKILEISDIEEMQEGCLSVPGAYAVVKRGTRAKVGAQDRQGNYFEIVGEGLLAECLQHEIDHLNGKLYIDLLSPYKRERAKQQCIKYLREMQKEKGQK